MSSCHLLHFGKEQRSPCQMYSWGLLGKGPRKDDSELGLGVQEGRQGMQQSHLARSSFCA